ncbi:hypothetical protein DMENIID0001_112370 [Sergentomyia squamirostris]
MAPTTHKILARGDVTIRHFIVSNGDHSAAETLSQAAEARNKHIKSYRKNFARRTSRKDAVHDVFHRLLISSAPFLSCTRCRFSTPMSHSKDAIALLKSSKPFAAPENDNVLQSG